MLNKWYVTLAFVLAAVVIVFWIGYDRTNDAEDPSVPNQVSLTANIPHKVGDFDLVGLSTGEEAISNISRLHGTGIDIVDAYIAEYANPAGDAFVLWVSESRDEEEATMLFDVMDEKMPNSPMFQNRAEVTFAGQRVIYVTGAGMENYYWATGLINYWVGIHQGDDEQIMNLVIDNF